MADLDLDAIAAIETEWDGYADDAWVTLTVPERDVLVAEVRRLRAENAILKAQQCPHNSKTFGQCIICGWTGRPACSECGEPVRLDRESCPACGAWENAVEAR